MVTTAADSIALLLRGVEVLRARSRRLRDRLGAGDDAPRRAEHAVQQIHDDQEHGEERDVPDPPKGHRCLRSATIAAFPAIPGSAPRMISNCALIALTAGSSGRRCSASTVCSADDRVANPWEILSRRLRTMISAAASTRTTTTDN